MNEPIGGLNLAWRGDAHHSSLYELLDLSYKAHAKSVRRRRAGRNCPYIWKTRKCPPLEQSLSENKPTDHCRTCSVTDQYYRSVLYRGILCACNKYDPLSSQLVISAWFSRSSVFDDKNTQKGKGMGNDNEQQKKRLTWQKRGEAEEELERILRSPFLCQKY